MRIPEDASLPITDLSAEDMDKHWEFYWESEDEQGNIPLSYGEYVREYKGDLILMANQREGWVPPRPVVTKGGFGWSEWVKKPDE